MKKRFVIRQNVCKGSADGRQYQIKACFYFIVEMPPALLYIFFFCFLPFSLKFSIFAFKVPIAQIYAYIQEQKDNLEWKIFK